MSEKKQWELRVKCLVLDHDDTVVKSTPEINFPAFLRSLKDLRGTTMSYEQFVEYNFDPGFYEMCADILHYTPEEIRYQEAEWERAAAVTIPEMAEEANYNMIDGLMNNIPRKKDKNAPRRSVLKRLRNHQKKIASQRKGQPQKEIEEEMERKKK